MKPYSLKFSPLSPDTPKRRVLGEIQNLNTLKPYSLKFSPLSPDTPKIRVLGEIQNLNTSPINDLLLNSPIIDNHMQNSPLTSLNMQESLLKNSPLSSQTVNSPLKLETNQLKRSSTKISKIFEERTKFRLNKENISTLRFESFEKEEFRSKKTVETKKWSFNQMTESTASCSYTKTSENYLSKSEIFGHLDENDLEQDLETLQDLNLEFECQNFEKCNKYEIISTDSPDIISKGRSSNRKISGSKKFNFGAPIALVEQSTSFNKTMSTSRMLNFKQSFDFVSPSTKKSTSSESVKKSLKFSPERTTYLRHESSNSSIGTMSNSSPAKGFKLFNSASTNSIESGFQSELEEQFLVIEEKSNSPKVEHFSELISGAIKEDYNQKFNLKRPLLSRSISYNPNEQKARMSLFAKQQTIAEESVVKKQKFEKNKRPVLQRAYSENAASIISALARSASNPDLIGDFSQPFALPMTDGNHSDLKSISSDTLAALLRGEFGDTVAEYELIDCRYPYEYEGGHIQGAKNMYTPQQILELVNRPLKQGADGDRRKIIVFHCEFSLERGPKLSRFLRSSDRAKNKDNYPSLHYPEIYLLHEGYSSFFASYPEFCEPKGYTMMTDAKFKEELSSFRRLYPKSGKASFML